MKTVVKTKSAIRLGTVMAAATEVVPDVLVALNSARLLNVVKP